MTSSGCAQGSTDREQSFSHSSSSSRTIFQDVALQPLAMSHPRRRISIKPSSSIKKPAENESRTQQPSQPRSLPSSHLNPIRQPEHSRTVDDDDDIEEDELSRSTSSLGPEESAAPQFQPFFTLISDPSTAEHHHPTVHYIFADDDPDIITEAACRSLVNSVPSAAAAAEALAEGHGDPQTQAGSSDWRGEAEDDNVGSGIDRGDEIVSNKLPPIQPGVREHYILLDVHPQVQPPSGSAGGDPTIPVNPDPTFEIISANSLSPHWALLNTSISTAPTMGGESAEPDPEGPGQGLMLKIEGVGAPDPSLDSGGVVGTATGKGPGLGLGGGGRKGKGKAEALSVQEMMEGFEKGLETVRKVMEGLK